MILQPKAMKPLSPHYYPTTSSGMQCCSTGHPVLADPLTGRTVCSCQMQSGIPAYLARVPSLPENFYKPGNSDVYKTSAREKTLSSAFIPTNMNATLPNVHPYYLEQMMAAQSYGMVYPGMDINSIRRKNTNREATGPLKSWLFQHRKNPYPTKAEKIMLAIISQMTLTQVSTWFANARRRLKKESKMEEKDLDLSDIDVDDSGSTNESFSSRLTDSDAENHQNKNSLFNSTATDFSDVSDAEDLALRDRKCINGLLSPDGRNDICLERNSSSELLNVCKSDKMNEISSSNITVKDSKSKCSTISDRRIDDVGKNDSKQAADKEIVSKPKIWSIASMI